MKDDEIKTLIYRYALINAAKHKGKAQKGAVMGSIMSSHPEVRGEAKNVAQFIGDVLETVNSMDLSQQKLELKKLGFKETVVEKKKEKKGLVDLPDIKGPVIMRFAPNPSGPLHIGHARAAILNQEYLKRYGGKLILRLEDTDPRRVDPDAYQMIEEDLNWLKVKWQEKFIQSDRIPLYYEYAEKLIELGAAYMCTCEGSEFKKLKDESQPCPCRELPVEENRELWKKMGSMPEGGAVLRVKTDLDHKNPAIRDWVAMRIVEDEHPRIGSKYRIYPLMNFAVAVDDHLLGITHVLRGKDHLANSEKQEYLYHHFGWKIPTFVHYGRLKMEDVALSTSKARKGIEEGLYTGWDDPRLGTIRAIHRRGIKPEALRELMVEIGIKMADTIVSWKKIYGLNRPLVEKTSNRYFFVPNPVKVEIEDLPKSLEGLIERPLHPDFPERGCRELNFEADICIPAEDLGDAKKTGKPLRLIDAVNIKFDQEKIQYVSTDLEYARKAGSKIVQWVAASSGLKAEIIMPDTSLVEGVLEASGMVLKVDDVVQLERFGFARVDQVNGSKIRFYFAHK
jgi:glutamyl-tRNA synthetase